VTFEVGFQFRSLITANWVLGAALAKAPRLSGWLRKTIILISAVISLADIFWRVSNSNLDVLASSVRIFCASVTVTASELGGAIKTTRAGFGVAVGSRVGIFVGVVVGWRLFMIEQPERRSEKRMKNRNIFLRLRGDMVEILIVGILPVIPN
jgi:hypothetical protein